MGGLTSIWKDRGVTLETKVKLVKVLVFPIVLYGAETWTMRKHKRNKDRRFRFVVLEKSTQSIVDGEKDKHIDHREHQTGMDTGVKGGKAAVSYFGHVVRAGGMEDDVMIARMNGARKRGRPRQRWVDTLNGVGPMRAEPRSAI